MGCWWKRIALGLSDAPGGSGSWARRVALLLDINPGTVRGSWSRIIALAGDLQEQTGSSWARRLTPVDAPYGQSWVRKLALSEVLIESFSPFSITLFESMVVQPDDTRKSVIDTFIKALVAAGVWDLLDVLYVFAAHTQQAALLNWKDPGTFDATLETNSTNFPTFTTDRGFAGNGSDAYISSNFNPNSAGGVYVQNSAHVALRTLDEVTGTIVGSLSGPNVIGINPANTLRLNDGDIFNFFGGLNDQHLLLNRSAAAAKQWYIDGVLDDSSTVSSTNIPADNVTLLANVQGGQYATALMASASLGASLSALQVDGYVDAELAYMQAVGGV